MLKINKKRRIVISILAVSLLAVPVSMFAVNKLAKTDSTSAITYPIPEGYTAIKDPSFYDCVLKAFKSEYPDEDILDTGLSDGQLGRIKVVDCKSSGDIANITGAEKLTSIESLIIQDKTISDISNIRDLASLKYLYLDGNLISDISPLSGLVLLESLDISHNQVAHLPIANLEHLKKLIISDNLISDISVIRNLDELEQFEASGCKISDIAPIGSLTSLTRLVLGDNNISDITQIESLTSLTYLNLNNSNLSNTDVSVIGGLTSLKTLFLDDNQISDISFVENLVSLENLRLSGNHISDITPAAKLNNLKRDIMDSPHHHMISLNKQTITDVTNSINYVLPTLFQYAYGSIDRTDMAEWIHKDIDYGSVENNIDLILDNATLNSDGRSITITDISKPVTINTENCTEFVHEACSCTLTLTYDDSTSNPVDPDPVDPDPVDPDPVDPDPVDPAPTAGSDALTDADFRACVINAYNREFDADATSLTATQLAQITNLNKKQTGSDIYYYCGGYTNDDGTGRNIKSLNGISSLTNLSQIDVSNNSISNIDVSANNKLEKLYASGMKTSVNSVSLPSGSVLKEVMLRNDGLSSIDFSGNTGLNWIDVRKNNISSISGLESNKDLTAISLMDNNISALDVHENTALVALKAYNNPFNKLDISNNKNISNLQLDEDDLVYTGVAPKYYPATDRFIYNYSDFSFINDYVVIAGSEEGRVTFNKNEKTLSIDREYLPQYGVVTQRNSGVSSEVNDSIDDIVRNHYLLELYSGAKYGDETHASGAMLIPHHNYKVAPNAIIQTLVCSLADSDSCSVVLPNINSDEAYLQGWADDADATTPKYRVGQEISISGITDVYAVWGSEPVGTPYMIVYNFAGGLNSEYTDSSAIETCVYAGASGTQCTTTITDQIPVKQGYTFMGWASSENAASAEYTAGDSIATSGDTTLYAVWKEEGTNPDVDPDPENPNVNPDPDSDTATDSDKASNSDKTSPASSDESEDSDLMIPNTSAGVSTPNTGKNTKNTNGLSPMITFGMPIMLIGMFVGRYVWRRKQSHRKFD